MNLAAISACISASTPQMSGCTGNGNKCGSRFKSNNEKSRKKQEQKTQAVGREDVCRSRMCAPARTPDGFSLLEALPFVCDIKQTAVVGFN